MSVIWEDGAEHNLFSAAHFTSAGWVPNLPKSKIFLEVSNKRDGLVTHQTFLSSVISVFNSVGLELFNFSCFKVAN